MALLINTKMSQHRGNLKLYSLLFNVSSTRKPIAPKGSCTTSGHAHTSTNLSVGNKLLEIAQSTSSVCVHTAVRPLNSHFTSLQCDCKTGQQTKMEQKCHQELATLFIFLSCFPSFSQLLHKYSAVHIHYSSPLHTHQLSLHQKLFRSKIKRRSSWFAIVSNLSCDPPVTPALMGLSVLRLTHPGVRQCWHFHVAITHNSLPCHTKACLPPPLLARFFTFGCMYILKQNPPPLISSSAGQKLPRKWVSSAPAKITHADLQVMITMQHYRLTGLFHFY